MNNISDYLSHQIAAAREIDVWHDSRHEVATYLIDALPPLDLVTSVRAIVRQGGRILTVQDPDRTHILPGGRREAHEALEQTLRRELLEETGWEVGAPTLIGLKHFHHLTPRPPDYRFPYPDFLQLIYTAAAAHHRPAARNTSDYVLGSAFLPLAEVRALPLFPSEQALLAQAIASTTL